MGKCISLDIDNAIYSEPPVLDMILAGLKIGNVGGIIAPGSTGKSMLALELAVLVGTAGGCNLLGFKLPMQSPCWQFGTSVAYITAEDDLDILQRRMHFIGTKIKSEDRENLRACTEIISLAGYSPYLITGRDRNEDWIKWLSAVCMQKRLVIIDTLARFHNASENDAGDMKVLLGVLEEIAHKAQCAIVFLHHANKISTLTGQGAEQGASRGSSVLTDNIRWQLNMSCMSKEDAKTYSVGEDSRKNYVLVSGAKMNYGTLGNGIWLQRNGALEGVLEYMDLEQRKKDIDKKKGGRGHE